MTAAPEAVQRALDAAKIPLERRGSARARRLTKDELGFYHWILRSLAGGGAPASPALAEHADRLGVELEAVLVTLAREDLIHTDQAGTVVVAYPFSGRPTAHRVRLNGHQVYAMCAIDALGMAPMFSAPVVIDSSDAVTGDPVHVELEADGQSWWTPHEAVVVVGSCCEGAAFSGCCEVLNFFAAPANAERYLSEHDDVGGHAVSMPEAIEAGRIVFGDVFGERQ